MDADLIVRGEGQARALPDRAGLRVAVEGEGGSREDAYGTAAELAKAVDDVIARHGDAIDKASTASLVVHPTTRWKRGEHVRTGWRASRSTSLEVTGFESLGQLIAELSAAGASIMGPSWQLDPENAAHREARRLAAEDARRRAEDYAVALGLKLGPVAWIAEPGLHRVEQIERMTARAASAMVADDVIEVTPDEIPVRAAVEVGFSFAS